MIAAAVAALVLSPQVTILANGIPVILAPENGAAAAAIQVLVRTNDLTPTELGALDYLAGAFFGNTDGLSYRELQRIGALIGRRVVVKNEYDCFRIELITEPRNLESALTLISNSIRRPLYDEESAKRGILAAGTPLHSPARALVRSALALNGAGPAAIVPPAAGQLLSLHEKIFRPGRMAVAIVGKVSVDRDARAFSASMGSWNPQTPSRAAPFKRASAGAHSETGCSAIVKGPAPAADSFAPWLAAVAALGMGKGSLLQKQLRYEAGLAYIAGVHLAFRSDGALAVAFASSAAGADAEFRAALASLEKHIDAEALARAKGFLKWQYQFGEGQAFEQGNRTPSQRAYWLAWWELFGGSFRLDSEFLTRIDSVTLEQAISSARAMKFSAN